MTADPIGDAEYNSMGKHPVERVEALLGKLHSIGNSKDRGSQVSQEGELLLDTFVQQVEKVFKNLPKPLEWRSFYNNDLNLLVDICMYRGTGMGTPIPLNPFYVYIAGLCLADSTDVVYTEKKLVRIWQVRHIQNTQQKEGQANFGTVCLCLGFSKTDFYFERGKLIENWQTGIRNCFLEKAPYNSDLH